MKFTQNKEARKFKVGNQKKITLSDMGRVFLNADEQITFITDEGSQYDVCRKDWGFYATPSVNGRLIKEGFKTALVKNENNMHYIMLVELSKKDLFEKYCLNEKQKVVQWLDII